MRLLARRSKSSRSRPCQNWSGPRTRVLQRVCASHGSCRRSTTTHPRLPDSSTRRPKAPRRLPVASPETGLIALLHRLGLAYHKPNVIARKLDVAKQKAFIESYEKLLNSLGDNEAVLFADAVHPTHAARPVGCWAPCDLVRAVDR